MSKKFIIHYEVDGKEYKTEWYARSEENARRNFKMWHKDAKIISVE